MGLIYRILYSRALSDAAFDFLRNELRAYTLEVWRGRFDRRYRRLGYTETDDILTGKSLLAALGLSFGRVRALTSAGELPAVTLRSPHGRPFTYCKRVDVATVKRRLHALVDLRAAARILGLGRRRVRALLEAGLLAGTYSGGKWHIDRSELRLLSAQPALRTVPPQIELVAVGHALRYLHLDDRMGSELLRRVQVGEICHYGWQSTARNLATLRVARTDIELIRHEADRREGLGMSATAAAKELGIKSEVVYQLLDAGLLTSRMVTVGGRRQRLVTQQAIQTFNSKYCSLVEVAKCWCMSHRAALGVLIGQQLLPIVGPQSGDCRQYFFRREVVARASVAK
ncbi:helix-turn-helix domain-containing protein [Cupriavidus sp. amp6]|uniref:helix-turn-helix domain-containing protein n=1 Tax=Cupriavidus sp. amp6 TaxID=388051 RepID=UPI001E5CEB03|nr:helix-turn-helix domain-containing protein [Cupriavidus sp. amp6]